jgi:hypothetical protein
MQRRGFLAATAGALVCGSRIIESAEFADVRTSRDQGARNPKGNGQIEPDYLASVFPRVVGIRRLPDAKLLFPEEYPDVIAEEAARL